eukprot:jgi/Astpho2/5970/fgenesh1_pm.00080_%23_39_t
MPRPDGRRCLVIASNCWTVSRLRTGRVLHSFPSPLPGGSTASSSGADSFSILDCVFHEPQQTYYIVDVMCWQGYILYDCAAEFRLYWLTAKMAESCMGSTATAQQQYKFMAVPTAPCTPGALQEAYAGPVPFQRDGLIFLHKEGHYSLDSTPLALLWKDAHCSQYVLETEGDGTVPDQQQVVLAYAQDRLLVTGDQQPVPLGQLPEAFVRKAGPGLRPGRLLRCSVGARGIQLVDGEPTGADLKYEGLANQRRGRADVISKILFQYMARRSPITVEHLLKASGPTRKQCRSARLAAGD